MPNQSPRATLDARYSEENAQATPWPKALALLKQAGLFWVSTVRPDGRPHVAPVVAVWLDGALYFTSGPGEQKSRNLAANRQCAVTTGCRTGTRASTSWCTARLSSSGICRRCSGWQMRFWQNAAATGPSKSPLTALSVVMGYRWSTG
jgi:hypothetical protein